MDENEVLTDNNEQTANISENMDEYDDYELLELIGKKRGCIISGGREDTLRAEIFLLISFI